MKNLIKSGISFARYPPLALFIIRRKLTRGRKNSSQLSWHHHLFNTSFRSIRVIYKVHVQVKNYNNAVQPSHFPDVASTSGCFSEIRTGFWHRHFPTVKRIAENVLSSARAAQQNIRASIMSGHLPVPASLLILVTQVTREACKWQWQISRFETLSCRLLE